MQLSDAGLLKTDLFIGGRWSPSNARYDVIDPATGQTIAEVARATEESVDAAVTAAQVAQRKWRDTTATQRRDALAGLADALLAHEADLAAILTAEQGKPLAEAAGEIRYAAGFFRWFAEEARRVYGETIPAHRPDARLLVQRQPVGVGAAITPWNFPSAMIARKLAPAIAAGCALVLKPAEDTPLSALALAELVARADIPSGLFSVVAGNRDDASRLGTALCLDPRIRKLSFTGSTRVGKLLLEQCASTVKRVSLELGGNAPFIVFDDADLEAAIDGVMVCKFRNSGQTCVSANRIYVQAGVYDEFTSRLHERIDALVVGPGADAGSTIGPLITTAALKKVEQHVTDARSQGAKLITGGKPHQRGGTFFVPTLLTDVPDSSLMHSEETFGPAAGLTPFNTEAEVVQAANDTPYGLAAYFFTTDLARSWRVSENLESGMVGVNTGLISTPEAPFGGVKESGLGREGSRHGLDEWTDIKYVCVGGLGQ